MRTTITLCPLVILPLFLAAPRAAADPLKALDKPALQATPEELLAAGKGATAEPGTPVIILLEEQIYRLDEQGRARNTFRRVFKVLTQDGANDWSHFSVAWSPWYETEPMLKVRVITPDGKVHEPDPATITEETAPQDPHIYSDRKVKKVPFPSVTPGAVVEEVVEESEVRPFFEGGSVHYFGFGYTVPVLQTRVLIDAPSMLKPRFVTRLLPGLEPKKTRGNGRTRWLFERGRIDPPDPEDDEAGLPYDTPSRAYLGFSTGRSWSDVARRYHEVVEKQLAGGLDGIADELEKSAKGSREEKIAQALAYLHAHVRYTGLELGESSIVPWTPADTWKRKYGDCKDQATLLVGLLRTLGIKAHVALLKAGYGLDIEPSLVGLGSFNHAIVYVPGKTPIWIDPTDEFARAGELPLQDQNRWALVAAPGTRKLIRTPRAPSRENRMVETRRYELTEKGPARVIEITELHGSFERQYRSDYRESKREVLRKNLEKYVKDHYEAEKLVAFEHSDPDDLGGPFTLRLEIEGAKTASTYTDTAVVTVYSGALTHELPASLRDVPDKDKKEKKRKHPYELRQPYVREWRVEIVIPPGFQPRQIPETVEVSLGPARYQQSFEVRDNLVLGSLRFDTGKAVYSPAEVDELRKELAELYDSNAPQVVLEQVGIAHLRAGRIQEALLELRRLAELHPREALHHSQMAMALLEAGLGQEARKEARLATKLEPDSEDAWSTLGWILQHDELGRRFHKGFDWKGAVAAYEKARKLDPEADATWADYAILLEHNPEGVRYGKGARLDRAIAEYQARRKKLDLKDMDGNLLAVLLRAGRAGELHRFARTLPADKTRNSYLVAAAALRDGGQAGIKEASRLARGSDDRRSLMAEAGALLLATRHYPEAAALLREAARGAQDPDLRQRALLFSKLERHEAFDFGKNEIQRLVFVYFVKAFLKGGLTQAEFKKYLARREQERTSLQEFNESLEVAERAVRNLRSLGLSLDHLADFYLANAELFIDHAPGIGWRVTMKARVAGQSGSRHFFLDENGTPRAIGTAALAAEALARLERGDKGAATRILDWLYEGRQSPLWRKAASHSRREMELAAAALLVGSKRDAKQAAALLARCPGTNAAVREECDRGLYHAHMTTGRYADAAAVAARLQKDSRDPDDVLAMRVVALGEAKKWEEVHRLLRERLEANPEDALALRLSASALKRQGRLEDAFSAYERLLATPGGTASDQNNQAWLALFLGRVGDDVLETARQAVARQQRRDAHSLNTLAALLAARGEAVDAYRTMLESLEARNTTELEPHDWLVYGRVAQSYGYHEVARDAYRRVKPRERDRDDPVAAYRLAQRWLEELGR